MATDRRGLPVYRIEYDEAGEARMRELDELIAQGWGDTRQDRIPPDWRTRRGPDLVTFAARPPAPVETEHPQAA